MKKNVWMSWSTGKDSAYALYELKRSPEVVVTGLVTTVTRDFDRVSMHGVRRELLSAQAEALSLSLETIEIPSPCTIQEYEDRIHIIFQKAEALGVTHFAFGDLFLQDVREYRERQLRQTKINPLFPLWHRPTNELAEEIIQSGVKAILTCVDTRKLDQSFSGREYNINLLKDLSHEIDPCGERGEFHSFVFDSPLFERPISIAKGEKIVRNGFAFTDVSILKSSRWSKFLATMIHLIASSGAKIFSEAE